ncbi:MAG: PAS domain S-box protein [Gallionella sp.]|nr:PAS domain S-box protein [Gallionella sp.]MDD4959673.1 PAS domain S-box protein [Gallionella sp.]
MKLRDVNLSTRITFAALLLVIAGGLLWVVNQNQRLQDAYLNERSADLESALNLEQAHLTTAIETLRQDTVFLAHNPPISGLIRARQNHGMDPREHNSTEVWTVRLQDIFAAFLKAHPDYVRVHYIGLANGGRELVRVENQNGKIQVASPEQLQTRENKRYFQAGLKLPEGQVHLSEFMTEPEDDPLPHPQQLLLRTATPVFDTTGQLFGLVVLHLDVNALLTDLSIGLPPGVLTYVANQQGNYLSRQDDRHAPLPKPDNHRTIGDDFPLLQSLLTSPTEQQLRLSAIGNDTGGYIAARRIFFDVNQPTRFLLLAYHIPTQIAAQQMSSVATPSLTYVALVVILLGIAFMLILRHTFAPLKRITYAAHQISNGNQYLRIAETAGGEIGELTDALNAMLDKLSDREVMQRERDFRNSIIATTHDGYWLLDIRGFILEANQAYAALSGYTVTELLGMHISQLEAYEQSVEDVQAHITKIMLEGFDVFETRHRHKNGDEIDLEISTTLMRETQQLVVFIRDIRERKRIEKVIRDSQIHAQNALEELRYQKFALDQHAIVATTDVRGTITYVNEKFSQISGYSPQELIGQNHRLVNSGTHPKAFFREMFRTIAAGKVWHGEICNRAKNGELYWVLTTIVPYMSHEGKPTQYIAIRADITERKQADKELRIAATAFESHEGMVVTDEHDIILRVNQAFTHITGYTAAEAIGQKMNFLKSGRQADQFYLTMWQTIQREGAWQGEIWNRTKDGGERPHWLTITAVKDHHHVTTHYIGTYTDITERKNSQLILQHNQDLLNEAQLLGKLGSWELNLVSGELSWSDEIYRIFELDPALFQPTYENFLSVVHPDDRNKVNQAYTQSLENRQPYDVEHRLLFADGRIKWVREHCRSDFDTSGKALRSVGAVQDITETKQTEERLRVAAVAFETHEAIVITNTEGNIIRVNQAFQNITGYSSEEVLGKNPRILSSGRHDKTFYADMWQQLLCHGTWTGEIWDKRKSGQIYPKWLTITAVKDDKGNTTEYVAIFSDITARKQAEDEIRNLAFYDALTTLPNRRLLMDRLHAALAISARSLKYGALLFLDMDRFKTLNDTLGHDYGDLLLIEVAERIQSCVRESDTVARLGGDEFVVILEELDEDQQETSRKVATISEKIRSTLSLPYHLKDTPYHSSPSIGVSLYFGIEEPIDTLLKHADMAMYQAKDAGRNAVRFFDPTMQLVVETRARIEADLRHAIPLQQLHLYYQIQVNQDHHPFGAEALIRWEHPKHGLIPPQQFIPIAEESTLILEIGDWVLEASCQQLMAWGSVEETQNLILSVNVSGHQFRQANFVAKITAMLRQYNVHASCLKLELTESVVLNDVADVVSKMHALKALGIRLSMDDFGTGYSSLSHLKSLPLDQIKIDQSFVRDLATDANDAMMIQTIIDIGRNFKLNVIAEGVETSAQLDFLKNNGCMSYQGYFFSQPLEINAFMQLLEQYHAKFPPVRDTFLHYSI